MDIQSAIQLIFIMPILLLLLLSEQVKAPFYRGPVKYKPHQLAIEGPPQTKQKPSQFVSPYAFCKGMKPGVYPDEQNECKAYYSCPTTRQYKRVICNQGDVFDNNKKNCVKDTHGKGCPHKQAGEDPSTEIKSAEDFCKGESAGRYPDEKHGCKAYYICGSAPNNHLHQRIPCDFGKVFASDWNVCEDPASGNEGCPQHTWRSPPTPQKANEFCTGKPNKSYMDKSNGGGQYYYYCHNKNGRARRRQTPYPCAASDDNALEEARSAPTAMRKQLRKNAQCGTYSDESASFLHALSSFPCAPNACAPPLKSGHLIGSPK